MPALRLGEKDVTGSLIVFDKDGVLLDFHPLWAAVTRARVAAMCGLAAMPEQAEAWTSLLGLGPDGRVAPTGLLAGGSRLDSTLVAAGALHQAGLPWHLAKQQAYQAFRDADGQVLLAEAARPLPGVVDAVRGLHAAGWKLAVATTDQTDSALAFLQLAGLAACFDAVVGVDQVAASKPDPALFLRACSQAGVAPGEAIMVGDLDIDLLMGRQAGAAACVGVLSGVGPRDMLVPLADHVLPDVAALWSQQPLAGAGARP